MASYEDLYSFFQENIIVGKIIRDIRPFALDWNHTCLGCLLHKYCMKNEKIRRKLLLKFTEYSCILFIDGANKKRPPKRSLSCTHCAIG